jgi:tripartite-type tricarboxylate transporter receptor subunit TctC
MRSTATTRATGQARTSWVRRAAAVSAVALIVAACGGADEPAAPAPDPAAPAPAPEPEPEDTWPDGESVRILVGVAAGGGLDTMARLIEPGMSERLGTNITVENIAGANTTIANTVAFNEGDECGVILMNNFPIITFGIILEDVDFEFDYMYPIAAVQAQPAVVVVPTASPYQTIDDLLDAIRANPGGLSASVSAFSSINAVGLLQMEELLDIDINIVDFGGGNPARTAVVSGEVDFSHTSVFAALNLVQGGELRVLAAHQTASDWAPFQAVPELADVPLLSDVTGQNFGSNTATYGLTVNRACKDNYPQRYEKLVAAAADWMSAPEYMERLTDLGLELSVLPLTPDEYWDFIVAEKEQIDILAPSIFG